MQQYVLKLVHESSHLGIVKCKQRAREVFFWPSMNSDVEQLVKKISKCATYQKALSKEPLNPSIPSTLPYQEIGTDLFEFQARNYVITVDYYSKFIEVDELRDISSKSVINALRSQFCRLGIPILIRSDTGSQYNSDEFRKSCKAYGIEHKMSSPYFQSSNGEAERCIQTVKNLWKKCEDKHLALLDYRTTPLEGIGLSPAQLLMGRHTRNTLSIATALLAPSFFDRNEVRRRMALQKAKQKYDYDKSSMIEHDELTKKDDVRMSSLPGYKQWKPAVIIDHHQNPRSYIVQSNGRKYRRNRKHL
uniref:uncharacterized protein K02A2.6-like n=1 Tax=Styela clava TaxID=7725 RepID=UPI001939FE62|nr:uncharacterized protein K02A2.6-like [Styela clava]